MSGLLPTFHVGTTFFSHLRRRGALCLSSYLTETLPKVNVFKNGLRSAEAPRNENGSGAHDLDGRARGGTLQLGRTALGGYVKIAVRLRHTVAPSQCYASRRPPYSDFH